MVASSVRETGMVSEVMLKNGTRCRVRPLVAQDRNLVLECFAGLSQESRRQRFFAVKGALTESDLAFLLGADGQDHIAFCAVSLDAQGQEANALGVARCIREGAGGCSGEMAMAVVDSAQRCGLGTRLLTSLVEAARRQGISRLRCEVLATNPGMRALAAGLGSRVRWLDDGALEYVYQFEPETATPPEAALAPIPAASEPGDTADALGLWWQAGMRVQQAWMRASSVYWMKGMLLCDSALPFAASSPVMLPGAIHPRVRS